jgi:lysophospholipase L1-like esterase
MENRRQFLRKTAIGGLATLGIPRMLSKENSDIYLPESARSNDKGKVFLFQGDSITDGNRSRNNDWNHVMGHGYAYLIASRLWFDHPQNDFMFFNRGISGNKIDDLAARWDSDSLDLKPDVISILIGINDVYAIVKNSLTPNIKQYESDFRKILEQTKEKRPDTLFILLEPFFLPLGRVNEKPEVWDAETKLRQEITRKMALEFDTLYVPLQKPFIMACDKAPAKYWIWDGIHPMPAGHELIAREWIKVVSKKLKFIK